MDLYNNSVAKVIRCLVAMSLMSALSKQSGILSIFTLILQAEVS